MRLKRESSNKTSRINFRCTQEEEHLITRKALLYSEGNISEYILFAAKEFVPSTDDFEVENKKKGKK